MARDLRQQILNTTDKLLEAVDKLERSESGSTPVDNFSRSLPIPQSESAQSTFRSQHVQALAQASGSDTCLSTSSEMQKLFNWSVGGSGLEIATRGLFFFQTSFVPSRLLYSLLCTPQSCAGRSINSTNADHH